MKDFNRLVSEQLKTMDKLLDLQSELEACQEIELELKGLREEAKFEEVQAKINRIKSDLKVIHQLFDRQTQEVIRTYQEANVTC